MMIKNLILSFVLFSLIITISGQVCEDGKRNCTKCDYRTKLCGKCDKDILIPDENGGCKGIKECIIGNNYCLSCKLDNLCEKCEEGYFPDAIGGCSNTDNCEISKNGKCLKCIENFLLIGDVNDKFTFCKSLNSEDFKNCKEFNQTKGFCGKCEDNYYLNKGDHRCIEIKNCFESSFGVCQKCIDRYYYNKTGNECRMQTSFLYHCKLSINNETCDICDEGYYLAENRKCIEANFCLRSVEYGRCEECLPGYFLIGTGYRSNCTIAENCYWTDRDTGLCQECIKGMFLDYKDGKCKSNQNNDEFKYCKIGDGICKECIDGYYLGEDSKCTNTNGCVESENGLCINCLDDYYLGKDNKCSLIEHCIISTNENNCVECEENYCYNKVTKKCFIGEDKYKNCKQSNYIADRCEICKQDFYLNQTDNLCYSNQAKGDFYKCEITNYNASKCFRCINGYYMGYKYYRCSINEGCEYTEDDITCIECNRYYCFDSKTGKCEKNNKVVYEDKKFYYHCNRTNKEGTACEVCLDGFTLNEDGLCIDKSSCKEEVDGKCIKCPSNAEDRIFHYHCLNSVFGCIETFMENCVECNDLLDLDKCTKCIDGYKINPENNKCVKK